MESNKPRGLKFEYLLPHLTEEFKLYLSDDVINIQKCFGLTVGASEKFKHELDKNITKNYTKAKPTISRIKKFIHTKLW
jgi:hypothetical protein